MPTKSTLLSLCALIIASLAVRPGIVIAAPEVLESSTKQIVQCHDVDNFSDGEPLQGHEFESISANNLVTPYRHDVNKALRLRKGATVTISVLEQPKRGNLFASPYQDKWPAWGYLSERGYVGHDRIVFLVKANGKELRVIMNLLVGLVYDGEPSRCKHENFPLGE